MSAGEESNSSEGTNYDGSDAWQGNNVNYVDILPAREAGVAPYVEIVEQPMERGHRFRYACEGNSHGVIKGKRSVGKNRSFPSIRVNNFTGKALFKITLVTRSGEGHNHELTGSNCNDGVYEVTRSVSAAPISFQDLSVLHVTKKKAEEKRKRLGTYKPPAKGKKNEKNNKSDKNDKNDKTVYLKFDVGIPQPNGLMRWLEPVISGPIYDAKGTTTSALSISRLSKYSSSSAGNEEIFLLCDKVNKDDISVRFYEINAKGDFLWESFGVFGAADVHHQVAIVFRTPSYFDSNIKNERMVKIQLVRPSDGEKSEGVDFKYRPPVNTDMETVTKKRKKPIPNITNASDLEAKPMRRNRKPRSQESPPVSTVAQNGYSQPQISPQMIKPKSPPMAANGENELYQIHNHNPQGTADVAFLLHNEPSNRMVLTESMLANSGAMVSPSPVSSQTAVHDNVNMSSPPPPAPPPDMAVLDGMKMSPAGSNPDSPHQVMEIDGTTYITDENGFVINLDDFAPAVIDEHGNPLSVDDILGGGSQYQIIAVQDQDGTSVSMRQDAAVEYLAPGVTSGAIFQQAPVYSTVNVMAQNLPVMAPNLPAVTAQNLPVVAAQNLPVVTAQNLPTTLDSRPDIQMDSAPESIGYTQSDDIELPSDMHGRGLIHPPFGKKGFSDERVRSIYDSGLGSIKSCVESIEAGPESTETARASEGKVESTKDSGPADGKAKPSSDQDAIVEGMKALKLTKAVKATTAVDDSAQPAVDLSPPLPQPQDVENRSVKDPAKAKGGKAQAAKKPTLLVTVRRKDQALPSDEQGTVETNSRAEAVGGVSSSRGRGRVQKCSQRGVISGDRLVAGGGTSGEVRDVDMSLALKMSQGLQCFARTGDIQYLLALQRHLIDVPDGAGDNALHLAVVHRKLEPLRHLLMINQKIPNSNAVNAYNEDKQTPLHLAVICDEDYMVELLMEYGAKLTLVNASGNNALQLACKLGFYRCVQSILTKGEGRNVTREFLSTLNYDGYSALHLATLSGNLRCVEHLVHSHADVNQRDGRCGYSPLHHAVEREFTNIVGYLLASVQDHIQPNIPAYNDVTALHIAASKGNIGLAAALVAAGADPEAESAEPLESGSEPEAENADDEDKDKDTTQVDSGHERHVRGYLTPRDIAQGNSRMVRILQGEDYSSVRKQSEESSQSEQTLHTQSAVFSTFDSETMTVSMLDIVTRRSLARLLDPPRQEQDWIALAKLFHLQELVDVLSTLTSPTLSLIDNLEAMETSVFLLKQKLLSMKRIDAVEVLHHALAISEKAARDHARNVEQ